VDQAQTKGKKSTHHKKNSVISEKLENLIDFLNNKTDKIDPLIKMAIAHYQFEAIHPFRDGNGRTGRLMNLHFLCATQLLDVPILFISKYILEHKNEYYQGLMNVTKRGDWKN